MLSPNRATVSRRASCQPQAARDHPATLSTRAGSCQWPATVFRRRDMRVSRKPCSRSPWADWLRFMKSMSISVHGSSRLNWVWRWRSGFWRAVSPAIHIRAGENVCIQTTSPTHASAVFASRQSARIASGVVTTGLWTTRTGIAAAASSAAATSAACTSTWAIVSARRGAGCRRRTRARSGRAPSRSSRNLVESRAGLRVEEVKSLDVDGEGHAFARASRACGDRRARRRSRRPRLRLRRSQRPGRRPRRGARSG